MIAEPHKYGCLMQHLLPQWPHLWKSSFILTRLFVWQASLLITVVSIPFWTLKCKFLTILSLTVNSSSEVAITKCEGIEPQTWSMRNNQIQLAMDPSSFLVFLHPFLRMLILPTTSNLEACLTVLEDDFNHTLAISACNGGHNQSWNTIYSWIV